MVLLPEARVPDGLRIYAIGDVHGCVDQLAAKHALIEHDLVERPVVDWRVIHLGDYIDRGPESRATLDLLVRRAAEERVICLLGNHDLYLLDFLDDPAMAGLDSWLRYGGVETLRSYGLDLGPDAVFDRRARALLHRALTGLVPAEHRSFLEGLPLTARFGDYLFVHAGLRPGLAPEHQTRQDLVWIREPFLSSDADLGVVAVHGHTPVDEVELRANRIGIDTGAVFGGALTCLVLEGTARGLLEPGGVRPLPSG